MRNNKVIVAVIVLIVVMFIAWFGFMFSPGSYQNVIEYEFNISEKEVIQKIHELKEIDKSLNVPIEYGFTEGRRGPDDYWYHFYVFYSQEGEVVNCWVRSSSNSTTTLAIVSVMNQYGKWSILEDLDSEQKDKMKKKFEERFLNKLKLIIDQD